MNRARVVAAARVSIARGSRSFAAASHLFAPGVRTRAWLLYAWCRACDDIADGQDHGGPGRVAEGDPQARLARMRALTESALAGETVAEMPFAALGLVAREIGLPPAYARDHLAGFARDAAGWRPRDEADLLVYCYQVAGVVGCMMALAMGVRPDDAPTLDRACELGIAFQLGNIARDIAEDAAAGRCYLPGDWLGEAGVAPEAVMVPAHRAAIVAMVARLVARAREFEENARRGAPALDFRSAWAVLAAADIYGGIGRKVAARGAAAWNTRVSTSGAEKLCAVARAAWLSARRARIYARAAPAPTGWVRPNPGSAAQH